MEETLISLIIPVYNTPEWQLEKCLSSVQHQTYKNTEILVIDDGSCAETADYLERYKRKDLRISVVHTKNQGLSVARNYGLSVCKGGLLLFVDSDDVLHPGAVEALYSALVDTRSDMAVGGVAAVSEYPPSNSYGPSVGAAEVLSRYEAIEKIIIGEIGSTACCRLASKEIWGGQPFIPGRLHEDLASMWEVYTRCQKVAVCKESLYFYYFGTTSSIHLKKISEKFCLDFWTGFKERSERLLQLEPDLQGADAYSYLVYCPQVYSATLQAEHSRGREKIKKQCVSEFRINWKNGKEYARKNGRRISRYYVFYISPWIYQKLFTLWRRIRGMRL